MVLGADTAALETGLKDAQGSLSKFSIGAGAAFAGVAAAVGVAAVAIGAHIKSSINSADSMGKAAQSAGMQVDEFSKLAYAASLSDVEVGALGTSLGKLAKAMSATAGGAGGPAAEAFKALGISVTDANGKLKSSGDVLSEVAGKFKWYEDGAAKTALAIAIFGKAGAAMIPLLNQGAEGIKEAGDEAERYGLVLDRKTVVAAEAFNDNLKRMSAISQGMWTQVTAQMLPAFSNLSQVFLENKQNSSLLTSAADVLTTALKAAVSVTVGGIVIFARLGAELSALWKVLQLGATTNWLFDKSAYADLKSALAGLEDEGKKTDLAFKGISATLEGFWKNGTTSTEFWDIQAASLRLLSKEVLAIGEAWARSAAPIIESTTKAKSALQSFIDSTNKHIDASKAQASALGQSNVQIEAAKIAAEGLAIAAANGVPKTDALVASMQRLGMSAAVWAEKANFGKQVFEQTRTPAEQFAITMERLNLVFENGKKDPEVYARGIAQAQDALMRANPAAQILGSSLETAFGRAMEKGAQLGDVLRSLVQDLAKAGASKVFQQLLYGNAGSGGTSNGILSPVFARPKWGR